MMDKANPFREASKKIETLWALTNADSLSQEEKDALSFAVMAVQFALQSDLVDQFNRFLQEWPRELTSEQENQIEDLEDD